MEKLGQDFYSGKNVVLLAKQLIGKVLVTDFNGFRTSGRIVETEAYNGVIDKASHAYGGRNTNRTKVMYMPGGTAYVYLCYGIHHLFNVVTNQENIPHAVLVRALEPLDGIEKMLERTGKPKLDNSLTRGPGNVSKALGIAASHSSLSLLGDHIYIMDDGFTIEPSTVIASPRIGVDYAAEDAALLYRFYVAGNKYVSGKNKPLNVSQYPIRNP